MTSRSLVIKASDPADPSVPLGDESQEQVVAHRGGILRVLGAPGTGKTTVALRLVLERVLAGVTPAACLVITPDRSRAAALRDRLTALLGARGVAVSEPPARSVISLAVGLLRRRAIETGAPQPWLLSGGEHDAILRELLAGHDEGEGRQPGWPARLRPLVGGTAFRTELRDLLMRVVAAGLDATDLGFLGLTHERAEWVAAARVLREYEEVCAMVRPGGFDPATAVAVASSILGEEPGFAHAQVGSLRLVVVDDAQDLDPGAVRLLRQLERVSGADLVVVGDPDSAVQGFRGAEPGLLGDAGFGAGPCVVLSRSHRQPPELSSVTARVAERIGVVAGAAHRRTEGDRAPANADEEGSAPSTAGSASASVTVAVARSAAEEARTVTASLRRAHVLDGIPWSDMAVFTRSANGGALVERFLSASGVPVHRPGVSRPLRDEPAAGALLALAGCCVSIAQGTGGLTGDTALRLLVSPIVGVEPSGLRELRAAARVAALAAATPTTETDEFRRESPDELLAAVIAGRLPVEATGGASDRLQALAAALSAGIGAVRRGRASGEASVSARGEALDVLWAIWDALDLSDRWRAQALSGGPAGRRADGHLDAVVALFDAAEADSVRSPGKSAAHFFEEMMGQEVAADRITSASLRGPAVTLTTPARALGREWAVVAVCGVQEGIWPNLKLRGSLLGAQAFTDVMSGHETSPRAARAAVRYDELRLFHVAVGRATRRLIVTAVRSDDLQPSAFLDIVEPLGGEGERPFAGPQAPATLPALVAELRREILSADESARNEAARHLAQLAAHGVPGADPAQWRELREASCRRDRRQPGEAVRLSPSHLDALGRCQTRWLFTASGGAPASGTAAAIGSLVHEIAATVDNGDETAMLKALEARWAELGVPATWSGRRDLDSARLMLTRLARHHHAAAAEGWHVEGREVARTATVGGAVLAGRIDRLERHEDGRLRVVDLKTGATKPTRAEIERHAQLGAYQLLLEAAGDRTRSDHHDPAAGEPVPSGGAALLQLGQASPATGTGLQSQPPLAADDDPGWAQALVTDAAAAARGSHLTATPGPWCRTCPVRAACPADLTGAQS